MLKHDDFIVALDQCDATHADGVNFCKVKKKELIDAYVDSFGVTALQHFLDITRELVLFDFLFDEELKQHIHERTHVKEPSCSVDTALDSGF